MTAHKTKNSLLIAQYMQRPRIDEIFDQATRCRLVYVIAGAGYGKTQAVRQYIDQQPNTVVRWVQLTDGDNICSNFWEHITHNVSFDNPELAVKMRELGFPETLARFKQFTEILKTTELHSQKTFLVLDDFHLTNDKQALTFVERCVHRQVPGICVIIISRKEPEINAVSLFAKGKACIVTEDDLRFTEDEIAEFLKLRDIPFLPKNISRFYDATKGWAIAIQLLSLILKRIPDNLDFALDTMKQNVFKLFETETFNDFPENTQKILIKSALLSDLPLTPLHMVSDDIPHILNYPQLASFIWHDSLTGDYRIHPLYMEFLQSKIHLLSAEETQDTYRQAAQWCSENNFHIDAVRYFAKAHQYERILEELLSYPFKMPPDTCEYYFKIIEGLDQDNEVQNNQSVLLLKSFFIPLLLLGMGRYKEARERSFKVIREWEKSDAPFALNLLCTAYSNLAYIDMYTCTVTHKYNSPKYLKKSVEYYKMSTMPPVKIEGAFAVPDIRSFTCLVGEGAELEEFDRFLDATKQTAFYISETDHNMYYGYEDLVACEIAYQKNQLDLSKKNAHQAILKAREKKQYSIEAVAAYFLLRISLHEGNYSLAKEILKQLHGFLDNSDFWSRQLLYDLFSGVFYSQIGLPDMAPSWLIMNDKEANTEAGIPISELAVYVNICIAFKKYDQALAVLNNSYPREPQERFAFGELLLSMQTAVVRLRTGDVSGAMDEFKRTYALSYNGVFEMPFIEAGKNLHPLCVAARQTDCGIPDEWLRMIDRKASVYAKKTAVIRDSYKAEKKIEDTVSLSERELEVLNDLYHGLTREEIAESRYISISTVKKTIESMFLKLDANNVADAIRIAIKSKWIIE